MIDLKPQIKTKQTNKTPYLRMSYSNCNKCKTKRKTFKKPEEKTPYLERNEDKNYSRLPTRIHGSKKRVE